MKDLSWMEDIDIKPFLDGDMATVYGACGEATLMSLWSGVPSMTLYVSTKAINEAKRVYIQRHFNGRNGKDLALFLEVSEKFVQEALSRPIINHIERPSLF